MMAHIKIEDIEGIGEVSGQKFRALGITSVEKLLENARTKKQRQDLAEQTDISEKRILRFANMADLYRINGVGQEFSELLEAAGVDTVPELAQRNAANLTAKMKEVNEEKKLARRSPNLAEVEKWVAQAKELPRALEY
jgi:predicted flap endonuclease-1-like 5' DNA nuclease